MKEQLITFKTAKLANGKRFNIETYNHYQLKNGKFLDKDNYQGQSIKAPTQSLLQKWLRDLYRFDILLGPGVSDAGKYNVEVHYNNIDSLELGSFNTYEEALEKGLQEALKLIKTNEDEKN
jgi:hypothetical protein